LTLSDRDGEQVPLDAVERVVAGKISARWMW
jgi:hypothetical protein